MAHAPSFFPESSESLALQACDDIDSLHGVRRAYACIEKLVAPQCVGDAEEVGPTRTELGALMRLVNEELQRCIAAAEASVLSLRAAVGEGGAR